MMPHGDAAPWGKPFALVFVESAAGDVSRHVEGADGGDGVDGVDRSDGGEAGGVICEDGGEKCAAAGIGVRKAEAAAGGFDEVPFCDGEAEAVGDGDRMER